MQANFQLLIEYFRRCYLADSHDLSLANIARLPGNRRLFLKEPDYLSSGELPRIPLINPVAEKLAKLADTYRKERRLIYACFFVCGNLTTQGGFTARRTLCSPLLYFPARIYREDDYFAEINTTDIRMNLPLLRQILKPDIDSAVTNTFPLPRFPMDTSQVADMGRWLREYSLLEELEELSRWPNLQPETLVQERMEASRLGPVSAGAVILADRPRGSRGVLHELGQLVQARNFQAPLQVALGGEPARLIESDSEPEMLPGLFSSAQERALRNAARLPLSLVSGPPGTGKSFTIAAMAIDQMLHGDSVLVVSKTSEAIDVVRNKLQETYGLTEGYVHAGEQSFVRSLKTHLDTLLKEGVDLPEVSATKLKRSLRATNTSLHRAERRFARALRLARVLGPGRWAAWLLRVGAPLFGRDLQTEALWGFQDGISQLRYRFERQAARYINTYRQEKLARLLTTDRRSLASFHQALRARTSKTQAERFAQTNMHLVLQAYPIWLASLDELNEILPLSCGMFDLVIFDESTQCDIASALPALYRAKRAVVVGDGKQLRHVSFLPANQQQRLWEETVHCGELPEAFSYRDQSLLDLVSDALGSQDAVTLLDEHYRSQPELIAFSNHAFYADRLKVMQARPGNSRASALTFHRLEGRRARNGRNRVEKDWVISQLRDHFNRYENAPLKPSVGVLSPYREQANYLAKEVSRAFSADKLHSFSVRIATPYGFQGEERDVMFLSMAIDSQSLRAATYLNGAAMFNVAITRAKERQLVAYSISPELLSSDHLLRRYISFGHGAGRSYQEGTFSCEFARAVSAGLKEAGVRHWIDFPIAGQRVDVVCEYQGCILGVDLIGYPGEYQQHFTTRTYKILHRAGIRVLPLPYLHWSVGQRECITRIIGVLRGEQCREEETGAIPE
ncbi:ATP-binding protein [uncultured Microbulbifer sp.]|uniref:DEAD/DEAH box helicase n=1 Tax=uncultured Microbulbifer sp. TaxID=348147 RepID=UPI00263867FE|nr:ATP-binding protein [uncultured Microbulbifer sp.]